MAVKLTFDEVIYLNSVVFKVNGLIPVTDLQFPWKNLIRYSLVIFMCSNISIIVCPMVYVLIYKQIDQDTLMDILSLLVCVIGGAVRILFILFHHNEMQYLLFSCKKLWNDVQDFEDYKIMSVWGLRGRTFTLILFATAISTVCLFLLTPILLSQKKFSNITDRVFPFPSYIETRDSPQYEITYGLQIIAACSTGSAIMGVDTIILVLVLHGCGQFRLIRNWLQRIANYNDVGVVYDEWHKNKNVERTITKCIKRHRMVLDYCIELENIASGTNLVLVVSSIYLVSLSAVKLFEGNADMIKYMCLLSLVIWQLLLMCWPSDNLSSESLAISTAAYEIPWYRYDKSVSATISIMIMRAQKPVTLTAGKFVKMSLETFSSIMSSAASLFTVLHNM